MTLDKRWTATTMAMVASGPQVDAAVASAESKVEQAGDKAREIGQQAGAKIDMAAGAVGFSPTETAAVARVQE